MSSVVYWIHLPEHNDIFTQGYVGVSNNIQKRFYDHKNTTENQHLLNAINKYGWDNLVKQIILIADKAYCLMMEIKLRSLDNIGWNIIKGGGMPPITKWNLGKHLSNATKQKISLKNKGKKHKPEIEAKVTLNLLIHGEKTRFKKGDIPVINKIKHTCQHCNKSGTGVVMKRWHMDNCKFKENI